MLRLQNIQAQQGAAKQAVGGLTAPMAPGLGGPGPVPVAGPGGARLQNTNGPIQKLLGSKKPTTPAAPKLISPKAPKPKGGKGPAKLPRLPE